MNDTACSRQPAREKIAATMALARARCAMLLIDTATVPASDRLAFWSESSFDAYLPVQVRSPAGEQFGARMWGYELGPLSLFRIAAAPNTMMRSRGRSPPAIRSACTSRSSCAGRSTRRRRAGRALPGSGDLISYETSHPVVFRADRPYESLVVRVPRSLLGREEAADQQADGGRRSPGGEGLPRAAVAFFMGLAGGLEDGTITPTDAPNSIECVIDLIRALYAGPAPRRGGDEAPDSRRRSCWTSRRSSRRTSATRIWTRTGSRGRASSRPDTCTSCSSRRARASAAGSGTTRLERCRRDLLDPELDDDTILTIASRWGLPGPQHFSRLFRSAYGCSPSDLRRERRSAVC